MIESVQDYLVSTGYVIATLVQREHYKEKVKTIFLLRRISIIFI